MFRPSADSAAAVVSKFAIGPCLTGKTGMGFLLGLLFFCLPLNAATNHTVVIRNDVGGGVMERAKLIQTYQKNGTRIEIRGQFCMSACTMYLRLHDTCVTPNTVFGFHGPSSQVYGIALSSASFDRWSRVMADHYPEPLRSWFLQEGRHRIVGFHQFSGHDLIGFGVPRCQG